MTPQETMKIKQRQSWDGLSDSKFSSQAKIYNLLNDHNKPF